MHKKEREEKECKPNCLVEIMFSHQVFPFIFQCGRFSFNRAKRITDKARLDNAAKIYIIYADAEFTSGCLAHNLDANFYVITKIKSFIRTKRLLRIVLHVCAFFFFCERGELSEKNSKINANRKLISKAQRHTQHARTVSFNSFALRWRNLCVHAPLKLWQFSIPLKFDWDLKPYHRSHSVGFQ